jgi:hypothetical protein
MALMLFLLTPTIIYVNATNDGYLQGDAIEPISIFCRCSGGIGVSGNETPLVLIDNPYSIVSDGVGRN